MQAECEMATGLAYHPRFLEHVAGSHHPERPARLLAILDGLEEAGLRGRLVPIDAQPVDPRWAQMVHSPQYLARLEEACRRGLPYIDTPECGIVPASYDIALLAAGACTAAVDAVMRGDLQRAFCAVRPPGHHAMYDVSTGFCLLNNIAIAGHYARRAYGLERVLIFDWDVHHGNGTQQAFEPDGEVLLCSIHQDPRTLYPGTGYATEVAVEPGRGGILNLPMPAGSGDDDYRRVLEREFLPVAEAYEPQLVLVSAGFDAHRDDPLAMMDLTDDGFAWMGRMACDLADRFAGGRLIAVLEGGYNLPVLRRCVPQMVATLCDVEPTPR